MEFRIADTFTDSLTKLTGDEQKAVKTTAFDLQMNPANPGMQFHKLTKAKDKSFWSVRVNRDVRLIVHRTEQSLLLCYVDHHDDAYTWAERRKLETHPKTGAAQLVVVRETEEIIKIPVYVEEKRTRPPLFAGTSRDQMLSYGVPEEWLDDVLKVNNEDGLLQLADRLPSEAAEALLNLAVGETPVVVAPADAGSDPFAHPDAERRFRVMTNVEELERALDYPWEKWTIFLHPEQRKLVERDYKAPARVAGSAGTGKTIVAIHRAAYLAKSNPEARVLLTTFSDPLASALKTKLRRLISKEPRLGERLEVHSMEALGRRLYGAHFGQPEIVPRQKVRELLERASSEFEGAKFTTHFLLTEWEQVVDAWQLQSWESYRDVVRLGRKTRLAEKKRLLLWSVFEKVKADLSAASLITEAEMFSRLASKLSESHVSPYDFAVVDEAQDVSVAQLRFLAAFAGDRPNALFFAGDLGQRIFQQPFSWKSLGVDIRGRSSILKINYRTSHQIRAQADRLLDPELADVDGNAEERTGTISTFNGPSPEVITADSEDAELAAVAEWIQSHSSAGVSPHEIGLFVRSEDQLDRAREAVARSGVESAVLDDTVSISSGRLSVATMHLAKGLEFRVVAVMACDDEVVPLQARIETVADESDLQEVYDTERHLLYVACTRARDHLLVSGVSPASEFLDDLRG